MCADSIGISRGAPINRAVSATIRIAMAAPSPRSPPAIARSSLLNATGTHASVTSETEAKAEIELPPRTRAVQCPDRRNLQRESHRVDPDAATEAANRSAALLALDHPAISK